MTFINGKNNVGFNLFTKQGAQRPTQEAPKETIDFTNPDKAADKSHLLETESAYAGMVNFSTAKMKEAPKASERPPVSTSPGVVADRISAGFEKHRQLEALDTFAAYTAPKQPKSDVAGLVEYDANTFSGIDIPGFNPDYAYAGKDTTATLEKLFA